VIHRINRRSFLAIGAATSAACACATCPLAAMAADKEPAAAGPVDAGTLADYSKDGAYDAYAAGHGFFIVRRKGKLYALGSACTHKRTLLKLKGDALACPKHGARFDLAGTVVKAPAKNDLPRYAIAADDDGKVSVDTSRTFDKKQWDDAASFVALK
jgi:nitrite reductase/ring-hydroxylating ferredoxin subunit